MRNLMFLILILSTSFPVFSQVTASKSATASEILPSYSYFKKSPYRIFFHSIKSGETIESIAQLYGLTNVDVMMMNNLKPNSVLKIGQELLLEDRTYKKIQDVKIDVKSAPVNSTNLSQNQKTLENEVLIRNDFDTDEVKILQIEGTVVPKPSLVHFIDTYDIDLYKQKASQQSKMLFLNFFAQWCVPCHIMQESTFRDSEVAEFMNEKCVSLHINGDTEQGKLIRNTFKANVFPTLLMLDDQGLEILRYEGSLGIEAFKNFMEEAYTKMLQIKVNKK